MVFGVRYKKRVMSVLEKLKDIPVVLGSQSPRRQELLRALDIDFTVEVKEVDEYIDRDLSAPDIVRSIALAKLNGFVEDLYDDKLIIVSDTLVADESGFMIGKPKDANEARTVLRHLSGKRHMVYTAVAMKYKGELYDFVETTEVWFVELEDEEIDYYVSYYNPVDKAGSYGIQEWIGRIAVAKIKGSYENVMGLPTARLYRALKDFIK